MKKPLFIFILSIFILQLPLTPVSALGQVTAPIIAENARRGEQIHQELIIMNTEDKTITAEFSASGAIKDWPVFYRADDRSNPISTTTMGAREQLRVFTVFNIPADAPNGEYKGAVSVTQAAGPAAAGEEESSVTLAQKIDRPVTIRVSDEEELSLNVSVIPETYEIKSNEPLKVRIIYDNQGNINLKPAIGFKIRQDDNTFYNVIYPYPENEGGVSSGEIKEIPALEIPTANLADGKYLAVLSFSRGAEEIALKQFGFTISADEPLSGTESSGYAIGDSWIFWLIIFVFIALAMALVKKIFFNGAKKQD